MILAGCGGNGDKPKPPDPQICDALVTWESPKERTNGEEFTPNQISKYTLFISSEPDVETSSLEMEIDILDGFLTQWRVDDLSEGPHWFYMTVTDLEDRESTFSNLKTKTCET